MSRRERIPPPRVGGLQVYLRLNDDPNVLPVAMAERDREWGAIESLLDIALCMHETEQGIGALTEIGVQAVRALGHRHTMGNRSLNDMRLHVVRFLQIIRSDFPVVCIQRVAGDAATNRRTWGNDVDQYNPKAAGEVLVQRWVSLHIPIFSKQRKKCYFIVPFTDDLGSRLVCAASGRRP